MSGYNIAPEGYKLRYGIPFPEDVPDFFIDLQCWKHWREPAYQQGNLIDPWDCFWRGIYHLIPKSDFVRHTWAEQHVYDWTTESFVITLGAASSGKAQPMDAVVQTLWGPKPMGEIQVGERVLTPDGLTAEVIKTHDVGLQEEYCVTLKDGGSTLCAGSHLWEIGTRSSSWSRNKLAYTETLALRNTITDLCVPATKPACMRRRKTLITPYFMGALLGDGSFACNGQIRLSAVESDIVAKCREGLLSSYELRPVSSRDYMLVKRSRSHRTANVYIRACKEYGLIGTHSHDKFIPEDYLYNDRHSREELLRGLLDTDGTISSNGNISLASASRRLAEDIVLLVRSLGGRASISTGPSSYRGKDGVLVQCRDSHDVAITLPFTDPIFYCQRKQARVVQDREVTESPRYFQSVEKTGRVVPMKCITIDHPRGLYLTDDFIATHNSNDYGLIALTDWLIDPAETVTILASTTLGMLKLRSFESVVRYFRKMQRYAEIPIPGKLSKTTSAILLDDVKDSQEATEKASIRGVAVSDGTEEEATAKMRGAHLPYVRLILDELSQMRPAAMTVRVNMAIGAKDFKLAGLTNPDSFTDLAARFSIPNVPGGFNSLDPDKDFEWRSQYGKVRRHDGLLSPGIENPEKYPFLLTQKSLDELLEQEGNNPDSPEFWKMVRGWPPAQGRTQTLATMADVLAGQAMEQVTWLTEPLHTFLGIDPAFSSGGNRGVMQALDVGYDVEGELRLYLRPTRYVKVEASSSVPILEQIGDQIAKYCGELYVPGADVSVLSQALVSSGQNIGVDDSATQSVADYLQIRYGVRVRRFSGSARASEQKLAIGDVQGANARFYNSSTELWAATAAFIRAGQLRGLTQAAAEQLTSRPVDPDKRPLRLVSKKAKVSDGGSGHASPDEMDAVGYAIGVARFYLQLVAGATTVQSSSKPGSYPGSSGFQLKRIARKYDLDATAFSHAE